MAKSAAGVRGEDKVENTLVTFTPGSLVAGTRKHAGDVKQSWNDFSEVRIRFRELGVVCPDCGLG